MGDRQRDGYLLTSDRTRVDVGRVHRWLCDQSYWAAGRDHDVVARSIEGSRPYSVLTDEGQVAFARVVTDGATFAWLCDVFVLEGHRGRGTAGALVEAAVARARADGVRRVALATADAHELYRRHGFGEPRAGLFMELPLAGPTA